MDDVHGAVPERASPDAVSEEEKTLRRPENVPNVRVVGGEAEEQVFRSENVYGLSVDLAIRAQDLFVKRVGVVGGFECATLFIPSALALDHKGRVQSSR